MLQGINQKIGNVALVVDCYDEAIKFYTKKLLFNLIEDIDLGGGKRWVQIAPPNSNGTNLLLAKAVNKEQCQAIGNQAGGRVFLFLQTDNFWRDYNSMKSKGIIFKESPRKEPYGTVVVFEDLYGNKWDLIELIKGN